MSTNFPSSLDSLANPTAWQPRNTPWVEEATVIANLNDAVEALEAKVGINSSSDVNSLDYKVTQLNPLTTKGDIIVRSATAISRLPVGTDWQMIVADSTQPLGVKYTNPTSGGTVTTASVVSANWFTGSVANATTTPAITIGTSVTWLLKWNWTAVSQATQGTDYYAPSGTDVSVADGGTGVSSMTAYWVVLGGTTSTWPLQSVSPGSVGQVLTSNGTANPTFQSIPDAYLLLSTLTVTGLASLINSGTLTSYSFYKIVYDFTSTDSSTVIGMQINGDTSSNYISTVLQNTAVSTSSSLNAITLATPTSSWESFWEVIIKAKWTRKLIMWEWSAINGSTLIQWAHSYTWDATSFQFYKWSGTGTIYGTIKIYWKN